MSAALKARGLGRVAVVTPYVELTNERLKSFLADEGIEVTSLRTFDMLDMFDHARIQPSEVSDNGRFTVLRFPGNQELPTFFQTLPDGSEGLVPFDVRDEFVVLHTVASKLVLRRGKEVLCIFNEAVQPYGVNPGTNTASARVDRTTRTGAR